MTTRPAPAVPSHPPARARKPLTRREQRSQDAAIACGPGILAVNLANNLRAAHLITEAQALSPLAWLVVPLAVCIWH